MMWMCWMGLALAADVSVRGTVGELGGYWEPAPFGNGYTQIDLRDDGTLTRRTWGAWPIYNTCYPSEIEGTWGMGGPADLWISDEADYTGHFSSHGCVEASAGGGEYAPYMAVCFGARHTNPIRRLSSPPPPAGAGSYRFIEVILAPDGTCVHSTYTPDGAGWCDYDTVDCTWSKDPATGLPQLGLPEGSWTGGGFDAHGCTDFIGPAGDVEPLCIYASLRGA
jgi:hypothetical protein